MAENSKLTGIELNGVLYSLGKSIYEELDISLVRFAELLGRDFYCPTLSSAPTSSTLSYTDTDGESQSFQIGQPCRWAEGNNWRLAVCTNNSGSASSWYVLPVKVSELTNDAGYLTSHQDISHLATKTEVSGKVDKVSGKQLSTEDFTTALKNKLNGLSNYDDTTISNAVSSLQTQLNTLVSGNPSTAINSFNEIIAFLEGITDSEDLESIIASIEQQIAAKQDKISDLDTIRSGAAKGATALQSVPSEYITESELSGKGYATTASVNASLAGKQDSISDLDAIRSGAAKGATALQGYTEKYTGTVTGIKMNGASKGTSGVVDLGTVITSHQDISGKLDKTTAASTYLSKTDASNTYLGKTAKAASAASADSATKAAQDASGNVITSTYATKTELGNKQGKLLKFSNKTASSWVSDNTYADFPYRCDISCSGVTADMIPEVVYSVAQATSGDYAPISESKSGVISIWSKRNTSITIPTILAHQ